MNITEEAMNKGRLIIVHFFRFSRFYEVLGGFSKIAENRRKFAKIGEFWRALTDFAEIIRVRAVFCPSQEFSHSIG